jgi:hypothetical protein
MPLRDSERAAFGKMLQAVAEVYGRDYSPDVIAIYWQALREFDLAAVRQAFDRHLKNPDAGAFMPKPADLVRMLAGTSTDSAAHAWALVEWAVRHVGGYEDVQFDDPTATRVVDMLGGWVKLCSATEEEMPFRAREFQTLYRGFAMRREVPSSPDRLIGRTNLHNQAKGRELGPVTLIGRNARGDFSKLGERQLAIAYQRQAAIAAPGATS